MTTANVFEHLENLIKLKFAHISATVRDRAKQMKCGDHMFCRCSQQNIFQHFENLIATQVLNLNLFFLKKIKNCTYLRNGLGDSKMIEIFDFF